MQICVSLDARCVPGPDAERLCFVLATSLGHAAAEQQPVLLVREDYADVGPKSLGVDPVE